MKLAFFLLLALCCQNSFAFDYYILALQWPKAFCKVHHCARLPPFQFTIHGLWPSNYNAPPPAFCDPHSPFKGNQVLGEDLSKYMSEYWPNLIGDNVNFWDYEWKKHGTCSRLHQQAYFEKARKLTERLNPGVSVLTKLNHHGVYSHTRYSQSDFQKAVVGAWNFYPIIVCNPNGSNVKQLLEIRFCVDRQNRFFNCSSTPMFDRRTCDGGLIWFSDGL